MSEAIDRTLKLPEGSITKVAVAATATIADATRTHAATLCVKTAEKKRCVSEAFPRTPNLPKGSAARSGSHGNSNAS